MVLGKNTLRYGFFAAIAVVLFTLTNFFNQVQRNDVITDVINLSQVVLYAIFILIGHTVARDVRDRSLPTVLLNGAVAGLIVALALIAVIVFTENVPSNFMFRNLQPLSRSSLMLGQGTLEAAMPLLGLVGLLLGALGGFTTQIPARITTLVAATTLAVTVIGVLQGQISSIITLSDAVTVTLAAAGGYFAAHQFGADASMRKRILIGAGVGLAVAVVMGGLAVFTGMERGTFLRGGGSFQPTILNLPLQGLSHVLFFGVALTLFGAAGAAATTAERVLHNALWYFIASILSLGILSTQRGMPLQIAIAIAFIFSITLWFLPGIAGRAKALFASLGGNDKATSQRALYLAGLLLLLVLPGFIGLSLSNTLNLMMIYIIMGIGMNVMIGYAGLLDLGYVASFAIGAYTTGLLTTPGLLTCGGQTAAALGLTNQTPIEEIRMACTGLMTFWEAWPIAIIFSALTGVALGIPVLRLRGDYLAIVTLGFGEIIRVLVNSSVFKDLLGGPQGINGIPVPEINLSFINPSWTTQLAKSTDIYYLFLFTVAVGTVIVLRLVNTRLGRAWRALRDDEDVAEATGIHLVKTKLMAFAISSAFSGMGGALFGASLQGIFPNSFTLNVSIFVLSMVIVGGMGSIPAVFVGSLVLIGLPEALRTLQDYRLLIFGILLVVVMLSKPEGILPPQPPKLSERATKQPAPAGD